MLQDIGTCVIYGTEQTCTIPSFLEIVDKDMSGNQVKMSDFQDTVVLVVNVASKWGATAKNYTELAQLIDEYGPRGLKVLAFPCNQFAGQEPGSHDDILKFVQEKFKASEKFTWFEKGDVNGANTRDVFAFLKKELPNKDGTNDVRWSFTKFLVTHEGKPYKRFSHRAPPFVMREDIEELLDAKEGKDAVRGDWLQRTHISRM